MINLDALKYFYDTCRLNSMAQAADLNCVSRPAISQAIKKLESSLELKLLDHKRRELRPTKDGLLLMKQAAVIFSEVDKITTHVKKSSAGLQGVLTIGAARSLVTSFLDPVILQLKTSNPELSVNLQIQNSEELTRLLSHRKIDVALYLGDERLSGQTQIVIDKGHFQFLRSPSKKNNWYAITDKRPETERLKSLYKKEFKEEMPLFCTVPSWDAIQNWIERGICGGLLPEFMVKKLKRSNEVIFEKVFPYEIKAVFLDSMKDNLAITEFISILKF